MTQIRPQLPPGQRAVAARRQTRADRTGSTQLDNEPFTVSLPSGMGWLVTSTASDAAAGTGADAASAEAWEAMLLGRAFELMMSDGEKVVLVVAGGGRHLPVVTAVQRSIM